MNETRVLITCSRVWDAEEEVVAQLEALGILADMPRYEGQQLEESDLLPIVDRYQGILAGDDHLTRRVLEAATNLRVISKWGIGIDAIDLEAASELGVAVFNTPGVFGEELADYAMGYIHLLARRQHQVDADVRSGKWRRVRGVSLAGKTLGIVGLGSSGRALVRRAVAASMSVVAFEIADVGSVDGCELVPLEDLFRQSDIVSLHLPASPDNIQLVNEERLSLMPRGAWLINVSRGSLVDEAALVAALRRGHLGGAALDVFEVEPLPPGHPLFDFDNVLLGSHNGSNTAEAVARTTQLALENLVRGL